MGYVEPTEAKSVVPINQLISFCFWQLVPDAMKPLALTL
jgi:hypothetical protein